MHLEKGETPCIDSTYGLIYCKVRNNDVEVILATLTSGSNSLILRSVNICSFLY